MEVWVVSASKYGSTSEIAAAIAERIGAAGHQGRVLDAGEVDGFDGADTVVLGSAIYAGHWLKPARELLDAHGDELAARPTWLFSVGPLGDPPMPQDIGPEGISEAIEATHARGHEVFTGKLDRAALSRVERLMVRALHAPEGDFRDWARSARGGSASSRRSRNRAARVNAPGSVRGWVRRAQTRGWGAQGLGETWLCANHPLMAAPAVAIDTGPISRSIRSG